MISPDNIEQLFEFQSEIEGLESRIMSLQIFQSHMFTEDGFEYNGDYLITYQGKDYLATFVDSKFDCLTYIEKLVYTA